MGNPLPTIWSCVSERGRIQFGLQVLDGPPGLAVRRLSTFLLIPVGQHRRGFAFAGFAGCRRAIRAQALMRQMAFRKLSSDAHAPHRQVRRFRVPSCSSIRTCLIGSVPLIHGISMVV